MDMNNKTTFEANPTNLFCTLFAVFTAFLGYHINQAANISQPWSIFWAIMDFFFWFFAWIKWMCYGQVNLTVIKEAFAWFLQ